MTMLEERLEEFLRREAARIPDEGDVRSVQLDGAASKSGLGRLGRDVRQRGLSIGLAAFVLVVAAFAVPIALLNADGNQSGTGSAASIDDDHLVTEVGPRGIPGSLPEGEFPYLVLSNQAWKLTSAQEQVDPQSGYPTNISAEYENDTATIWLELRSVPDEHVLSSENPSHSSGTEVLSKAQVTQLVNVDDRAGIMYLIKEEADDSDGGVFGYQWLEVLGVEATLIGYEIDDRDTFIELIRQLERVEADRWQDLVRPLVPTQ